MTRRRWPFVVIAAALASGLPVQASDAPRSAIGWLSDVIRTPAPQADGQAAALSPETVSPFAEAEIMTSRLDDPIRNGIGLLSARESGFDPDMWADASALRVRSLILELRPAGVPAARELYRRVVLTETLPPIGSGPSNGVLLARLDSLMAAGRLEDARALIELAGVADPELFRRAFDIALLAGGIDEICGQLRDSPGLSPTFPARVFCLARLGDWSAAALTLQLAREVGDIAPAQEELLAWFLDPQLFEGETPPPAPRPLTTLDHVLREAVALPRSATTLPTAFLWLDAGNEAPLRSRIEARERLVREGAMEPEPLFDAYRQNTPAASGGVWDRMAAVQELDQAFATMDAQALPGALERADRLLSDLGLRPALATVYARQLAALPRDGLDTDTRRRIGGLLLLAGSGPQAARWLPDNNDGSDMLLRALALGRADLPQGTALSPIEDAVRRGLTQLAPPSADAAQLGAMIDEGRIGEAMVQVLTLLAPGPELDPGDLAAALYLLRMAGQDETARRVAAETILLLPEA
ncbi:hypothetical protein HMH01_08925 [Halovulum dunhuangense]|uniref:Tetratricopeptide repeat protein n=1 Tax=Halovulum dunhuangense TaxID=1505036 RepID=A0A849L2X4_9RHOB|nr:hypothetical protein [Halovulum dunhuangense]NNU80557.1 hypothetical protein [Halovulum dunhuangense]